MAGTSEESETSNITSIGESMLEQLNEAEVRRLVPTLTYLVFVAVAGIIGNSLVCHVYRTRYRLSNSQCFILCLSAIDLFSCSIVIPLEFATVLEQYTFQHLWLCKLSRFCNTLGTNSSSFLLMFIAIDRFRKVCKPFGWQISSRVAKLLCGMSLLLGIIVSWPALLIYGRHTFDIPHLNLTGTECSTDDSMTKTIWPFMNTAMFGTLFLTGIITICILYCLIGREVHKHVQKRPPDLSMNKSKHNDLCLSGELSVVTDNRKTKSQKHSTKQRDSRKKKYSESDISWGDRRSHDLSYSNEGKNRTSCNVGECNPGLNGLSTNQNRSDLDEKTHELAEHLKLSDEQLVSSDLDHNVNEKITDSENVDITECSKPKTTDEPENKRSSKMSGLSLGSDNCFSQTPAGNDPSMNLYDKNSRSRNPSISSRFSQSVLRLMSVVSRKSDAGPSSKTQYLKQARARKTAFLMFLISLAFVLSYLPHLLLMLIRQLSQNFLDDMTDSDRAVYRFFLRSYFLNCAINPVIYGVCDSRFRSAVKELSSHCCCSRYQQ